jgi:hypothetical protein
VVVSPGTRVQAEPGTVTPRLGPGEYCKDAHGRWWARPPAGSTTLGLHPQEVLLHGDGTITVRGRVETPGWAGRLRRGVWEPEGEDAAGPTSGS